MYQNNSIKVGWAHLIRIQDTGSLELDGYRPGGPWSRKSWNIWLEDEGSRTWEGWKKFLVEARAFNIFSFNIFSFLFKEKRCKLFHLTIFNNFVTDNYVLYWRNIKEYFFFNNKYLTELLLEIIDSVLYKIMCALAASKTVGHDFM